MHENIQINMNMQKQIYLYVYLYIFIYRTCYVMKIRVYLCSGKIPLNRYMKTSIQRHTVFVTT
jgi:hypothetical protein